MLTWLVCTWCVLACVCALSGGYIADNKVDNKYYCVNLCSNVNSDRNWCVLAVLCGMGTLTELLLASEWRLVATPVAVVA